MALGQLIEHAPLHSAIDNLPRTALLRLTRLDGSMSEFPLSIDGPTDVDAARFRLEVTAHEVALTVSQVPGLAP